MFTLLKAKNPYEQPARKIYAGVLEHIRQPVFYTAGGVPDTLDGRFELLLLHMFFVLNRLIEGESCDRAMNQALFDIVFADMDQGLREAGIGDMGIPKHMRRMMKAFNGRMHAYRAAEASRNRLEWEKALTRNLYGTVADIDRRTETLSRMVDYVRENIEALHTIRLKDIRTGRFSFKKPGLRGTRIQQ